jgi:hypothetical protein
LNRGPGGKISAVTERVTHTTVTFRRTFELAGVEGKRPAGTYAIETTEAAIDSLSFLAYRRVSTTIDLPCNLSPMFLRQLVDIDPRDLEAALRRDAAMEAMPAASAMQAGP